MSAADKTGIREQEGVSPELGDGVFVFSTAKTHQSRKTRGGPQQEGKQKITHHATKNPSKDI